MSCPLLPTSIAAFRPWLCASRRSTNSASRLAILSALLACCFGCTRNHEYPSRPILLVCPWGQGGGTDGVSRMLAAHLEIELGTPVNVVNATGGKGVTGHKRGLSAKPDGYTLTMTTLELNTMHWLGLTSMTIDDCVPLMSLNEDYAALLVRDDAPWQSLGELEQAIREAEVALQASGTTTGGAWHLAIAGWLIQTGMGADAVTWISSTGSAESLQELISGGIDLVCCALPEADSLIASGKVRALGVMSPNRAKGYETIATFQEQGTDWSLGGWRALAAPKGIPAAIESRLIKALTNITEGKTLIGDEVSGRRTFADFMRQQRFDHTIRTGRPLREFLAATDQKLGKLLQNEAMQTVRANRFSPYTFPRIVGVLLMIVVVAIVGQSRIAKQQPERLAADGSSTASSEVNSTRGDGAPRRVGNTTDTTDGVDMTDKADVVGPSGMVQSKTNWLALTAVIGSMLLYWQFAETVGFILIAGAILLVMMTGFRATWRATIGVSTVLPPLIYQIFAHTLRVPLPQGWLGW